MAAMKNVILRRTLFTDVFPRCMIFTDGYLYVERHGPSATLQKAVMRFPDWDITVVQEGGKGQGTGKSDRSL